MQNDLHWVIEANKNQSGSEIIPPIDRYLKKAYPGLQIRWSRVYGRRRWAYIYGAGESFGLHPLRIELGPDYGLYIDNPELIPPNDLEMLIDLLQKALVIE